VAHMVQKPGDLVRRPRQRSASTLRRRGLGGQNPTETVPNIQTCLMWEPPMPLSMPREPGRRFSAETSGGVRRETWRLTRPVRRDDGRVFGGRPRAGFRRIDMSQGNKNRFLFPARLRLRPSGGYSADTKVLGPDLVGSQQQWYTRKTEFRAAGPAASGNIGCSRPRRTHRRTRFRNPGRRTRWPPRRSRAEGGRTLFIDTARASVFDVFLPTIRTNASGGP